MSNKKGATPWRWRNAGATTLGQWLLEALSVFAAGQKVDLRTEPSAHVTWIQASPPNDHSPLGGSAPSRKW